MGEATAYRDSEEPVAILNDGGIQLWSTSPAYNQLITCYRSVEPGELRTYRLRHTALLEDPADLIAPAKLGEERYIEPLGKWEDLDSPGGLVHQRTQEASDGITLFSIAFCHPRSVVFTDLAQEGVYLHHRSGATWSLHFAGYSAPQQRWRIRPQSPQDSIPQWQFDPQAFDSVRRILQAKHSRALTKHSPPLSLQPWKYTGCPEIVSFMAYRDYPGVIDWLSLRSVRLVDANGAYISKSLGEVVEIMSDWREDNDELSAFAPGELRPVVESVFSMTHALGALAAAVAGNIAGSAAYDLIKLLTGQR